MNAIWVTKIKNKQTKPILTILSTNKDAEQLEHTFIPGGNTK